MPAIRSAEWALPGHPDQRCDAIADAIVERALATDPDARVCVDVMLSGDDVLVAGQVAFQRPGATVDVEEVTRAFLPAGAACSPRGLVLRAAVSVTHQAASAIRGGRALAVGYAVDRRTTGSLPPERWLVERIAQALADTAGLADADGTLLLTIEEEAGEWRPQSLRVELHDRATAPDAALVCRIESAVQRACQGLAATPAVEVVADGHLGSHRCGASNRRGAQEGYGARVRASTGLQHGRDPSAPSRAASLLAREVALWLVREEGAPEAEVEVAWEPGAATPGQITATVLGLRREVTPPFATDVQAISLRHPLTARGRPARVTPLTVPSRWTSAGPFCEPCTGLPLAARSAYAP